MQSSVHCSTIYNSQDMEATYMPTSMGMDKENVVHIHNGILLSCKKKERMPAWMDLDSVILSEVNQRKTNIWYHSYVEFFFKGPNELIYKTEIKLQM